MEMSNRQNKNAIVIGCYPDTEDKIKILKRCILSLESLDYDKILVSHCTVPESLQSLVDFCIYDKKNCLSDYKDNKHCYLFGNEHLRIQFPLESFGDYAYAFIRNQRNGFNLCKNYGYDYVMYIDGDVIFDKKDINKVDNVIKVLDIKNKKGYFEGFEFDSSGWTWEDGLDFIDVAAKTTCFIVNPKFWLDNINLDITPEEFLEYHQNKGFQKISIERFIYLSLENKLNEIDFVVHDQCSEFFDDSKFEIFPLSEMNWSKNNRNPLCKILLENKTNEGYFFVSNDSLTNDIDIILEVFYDNGEKEQVDIFLNKKNNEVVYFRLHKFNIKYNTVEVIVRKRGVEEPFYTEKYNSSDLKYSNSTIELL